MYSYQICSLLPIQITLFKNDEMVGLLEFWKLEVMLDTINGIKAKLLNPQRLDIDEIMEISNMTYHQTINFIASFEIKEPLK